MALASATPCIVINNQVDDLDVGYIAVDNVSGGWIAADYLVNQILDLHLLPNK